MSAAIGSCFWALIQDVLAVWGIWTVTGCYGHPWSELHVRVFLVLLVISLLAVPLLLAQLWRKEAA